MRDFVDMRDTLKQRAIEKAEASVDKRLEGMNEFRAQLKDERANFITVDKLESEKTAIHGRIDAMAKDYDALEKWKNNMQGRFVIIAIVITVVAGLIGAFISHLFK